MFFITENRMLENSTCRYEDPDGNRAYFEKTEKGFVGRIRFKDKRVRMESLVVEFPIKDMEGANLNISYHDGISKDEPFIQNGIDGFIVLVQRWIRMCGDIRYLAADLQTLQALKGMNEKAINQNRMLAITQYEELHPVVDAVFAAPNRFG